MPALSVFNNQPTGWLASVDVRAKILICALASIMSIAVSNFWAQALLVSASLVYAMSLRRPLLISTAYLLVALMSIMALGCFWLMAYFIPRLGQNFQYSSLLLPFMRVVVMINAALPLAFSSRIQSMLSALQSLRLPLCIYLPTAVVFRFLPEFCNDIKQIIESLRLRGYHVSPWSITRHPLLSLRLMFTPLLFRALRSSEDLGIAAELKGLGQGHAMTHYRPPRWTRVDTSLSVCAILVAVAALLCQLHLGSSAIFMR